MSGDSFTEPGRHVEPSGRIVYHFPPEGRFALARLLAKWRDENSTLIGYGEDGVFYDCEPDWNIPGTRLT